MSSFTGKFREYPSISADNFEKENLSSLAFFLSHCHKDHMSGLDSSAFHQRLKASQTVFVYCSETTRNLLRCDPSYNHLQDYVRSIPMEQQTMIPLVNDDTAENETICVTLLPAGHCVGSVMFLFEGHHGNVLYTGDFRLAKGDVKRIPFFHSNGSIKDIKSIYIDTTFCLPKMISLPSREQSRDAVIEIIDRWFSRGPECVVSLLCKGKYGFEYLLKEVALNYKTKIHVSVERLAMYKCLPDMTPHFTTDGKSTRIHACKWQSDRDYKSDLPCGSSVHPSFKTKVLRIKPTSMWVARDSEPMPKDFKRYHKESRMWRVVHSMHASMEEIQDVVGYLRPYHVYPNVPPAGPDTLEDAFERLRGLTRLQKCDSCNQEESDEILFREKAGHFNDKCTESREEAEQRKILEVARPAPNQQVLAQCKELGLEEEASSAPPPKRRRNKGSAPVAVPEEKASIASPRKSPQTSEEQVRSAMQIECQGDGINRDDEKRGAHLQKPLEDNSEDGIKPEMKCSTACKNEIEPVMKYSTACKNEIESVTKCSTACSVTCYQLSERYSTGEEKQSKDSEPTGLGLKIIGDTPSEERTKDNDSCNREERESRTKQQTLTKSVSCLEGENSQGEVGGGLPGAVAEFNVPPSPGHVEPLPNKLSVLHQHLQNGGQISNS